MLPPSFLPVKVAYLILFSTCVRAEKEFNQTVVPTMLRVAHFYCHLRQEFCFLFITFDIRSEKELRSYQKEVIQEETKLEKMKADNRDPHEVKKQVQ